MLTLRVICLAILIFISIILLIDVITITIASIKAMKNKQPYQKVLTIEMILLLIWSICLSILILV
jgi:hypothetical protein